MDIPPEGMGDFAFPCFPLAKQMKQSPATIAQDIAMSFPQTKGIDHVSVASGYVNFTLDYEFLISQTFELLFSLDETYGHLKQNNKRIIIEHTSANPNGPLHIGRARNPIIGDTLVRIFQAAGYSVESQFYLDDMGKQVAILTWGLQHIDPATLPKPTTTKPDHTQVAYYQQANNLMEHDPAVQAEINDIIQHLETGDKTIIDQVKEAYDPVLEGINESLRLINITIDSYIPESNFVKDHSVDAVVEMLKKTPYCHEEDGAYYLDMESFGIHGRTKKFFFTRSDGTTLYTTRDIAYHQWKAKQADQLINILGEDHKLQAKHVEIGLTLLKTPIQPTPVFYAFVSLPEGKMSTRRGRVVYLDDLIDECIDRAYQEVKKRRGHELTEQQMSTIAKQIGIGSLRYNIIKVQPEKDIIFKWEDALNFEGNAVPFIQYAHARACSILAKTTESPTTYTATAFTHDSERALIKKLAQFPLVIEDAVNGCKPHIIATYLFETASIYNQFYRDCPVLKEKNTNLRLSRLAAVNGTRIVLRNALAILGIDAPEEM